MVAHQDEQAFREFQDTVARVSGIAAQKAMELIVEQSKLCGTPQKRTAVIGAAIATLAGRYVAANIDAGTGDSAALFINMTQGAMIRAFTA